MCNIPVRNSGLILFMKHTNLALVFLLHAMCCTETLQGKTTCRHSCVTTVEIVFYVTLKKWAWIEQSVDSRNSPLLVLPELCALAVILFDWVCMLEAHRALGVHLYVLGFACCYFILWWSMCSFQFHWCFKSLKWPNLPHEVNNFKRNQVKDRSIITFTSTCN